MELNMLDLESLNIGAQPILSHFIHRLRLPEILAEVLGPDDPRLRLPCVPTALALLRNVATSHQPLYAIPEWLNRFVPELIALSPGDLALFNDDRIGRCLDRLYRANLFALQTRIIVQAVEAFHIRLDQLHNDSTTITFFGQYEPHPPTSAPTPVNITQGHNKDHRPDLKQLVFSLSISADGNVPVHYSLLDGNTNDDTTHIRTWDILRALRGTPDFIYVADCKLCTRESMAHIADNHGFFVTLLPRSRSEDGWFKDHLQTHPVNYSELLRRPDPRDLDGEPEIYELAEGDFRTSEGYRLYWIRSSTKREADRLYRQSCLERALRDLEALAARPGFRRHKTREEVMAAAEAVIVDASAQRWVKAIVVERTESSYKQQTRGRPGPKTPYVRIDKQVFELTWEFIAEKLHYDDRTDGLFPLVANKEALGALTVLQIYKGQAPLEKRHEQLKQVLEIMPVNLKTVERIEALVFLHFLALLLHALIERELRGAMKAHGVKTLPVYPERRECERPTAEKVLALFEGLRRHRLLLLKKTVRDFWDPLHEVHRQVLRLLEVPLTAYGPWEEVSGGRDHRSEGIEK